MKVTDTELMQAIWKNQLYLLSNNVLLRFFGNARSVCESSTECFLHASAESRADVVNIDVPLVPTYTMVRIKKLKEKKLVSSKDKMRSFYIDGEQAWSAFEDARSWWFEHGMVGGTKGKKVSSKFMVFDTLNDMTKECYEFLLEKHPSISNNTLLRLNAA